MGMQFRHKSGFTIVELAVSIAVLGILASITVVGYGAWQKRTTENVIKSDLSNAASAMENARNFGNTYPVAVPSSFKPSSNVLLTGGSTDGKNYCVQATSTKDATISLYVSNSNTSPQVGNCSATTGLVAWWPLNGNTNDLSGNGRNGTNNGATNTTNKDGEANRAYNFNGTGDYITASPINLAQFTINVWAKPSGLQTDSASIVSDTYPSKVNYALFFHPNSLTMQGGIYNDGWYYSPSTTLVSDTWYHLAFTYNGSILSLYVNGALLGSSPYSAMPSSSNTSFNIGRRWDLPNYFKGSIDDVRAYNRALSAGEVQALYTAGAQ